MDINSWRAISTLFVAVAFIGVCWWAFSPSRKKRFRDAANLPFVDDGQEREGEKKVQQHPDAKACANDEKRQD